MGEARQAAAARWLALGLLALLAPLASVLVATALASGAAGANAGQRDFATAPSGGTSPSAPPSLAVGVRVLHLVDNGRTIMPKGARREPRPLVTYVYYPALGEPSAGETVNAPPAQADGPFPLVVFGHGFGVTPRIYARLLRRWAQAGFVVAAPVFPLGNADTPGGPVESDVVNEPRDLSFVISTLLSLSGSVASPLAGLLDPTHIAVAGHSDGAEAALAAAYSRRFRDPRIGAAVILSGAMMSGIGGYSFGVGSPPLFAAQGTADRSNEPRFTYAYFTQAQRPKYLLRLFRAGHLPPYTSQQPQLAIVERVTIAFLDHYLKPTPIPGEPLLTSGDVSGTSSLTGGP